MATPAFTVSLNIYFINFKIEGIYKINAAIEDLSGIRMRETVKKGNKYIHNSWAFYQLRLFIEYKAMEAGIPVIVIDPHNTSRECPNCHTISKKNRPELVESP